jgi:TPP-dependent pyruvate/acetoin dehydrogenase alpha subunit
LKSIVSFWWKEYNQFQAKACVLVYSYHGHSMSDPGSTYRSRDEVTTMRQARDPLARVKKLIVENGFAEATELKALENRIKLEITEAIEESKAASQPPLSMLQANIYQDPTNAIMRGATSEHYIQATYTPCSDSAR